ncbi:hypothetical protein M3P36_03885 [Altererythrobacter sp. KTW20L]|uniref:hypothetical protein n=1 Tax=Altererythrobacter sp. KTW20L TaxID=2942210 RepID=UPI0020C1251F|nr:hypothetical protein [Altererythrobacter sp. KTW20L]MCL6250189.1 hypothetical protein [Altererythrobacter sp. KTW20L]
MVDILTLALTHGLMAYAACRLLSRDELDEEGDAAPRSRWLKKRAPAPPADRDS